MGLKDSIKNFFGIAGTEMSSMQTPNNEFDKLLHNLMVEVYKDSRTNTYWYSGNLGKMKAYNKIKSLKVETRKELLFYLIEPIKKCELITKKSGGYQGREQAFRKRQVYGELFSLLMRGNLDFTTKEIIDMLKAFKISDESNSRRFVDWPIGFSMQQIQRIVKKNGVSKELKMFLEDFLKWKQLKQTKYYWGTDLDKVRVKVEKILFENQSSDGEVAPYVLPDDRFAKVVNAQIENLDNGQKNDFYNLFHLFIKATGAKPSKKYLNETSSFIDSIGIAKYKSIVLEWIELATSLKAIETRKQYTYSNGQVYDYSTFEFLHEKNHIFLKGLVWSLSKFHDSNTLQLLARLTERCFEKIPSVGPTAASVGNACIFTLGSTRGLEGISHLSRLKLKIKQNNTKAIIEKYIEESSEKLGITASEIEEISIPDFGLIDGTRTYEFDDYKLQIKIEGIGKVALKWIKPDGTEQKTVPSFIKDSTKHKQALKKAKDAVAQIKKYLTAQRDRIDRLYLNDRTWGYESFVKNYLDHGLVGYIAKDLLWNFKKEEFVATGIWNGKDWRDINNKKIDWIDNGTTVELWHPINSNIDDVLTWRNRLEELNVRQVLKQVFREVYVLTDAEINTKTYSNRMAAHLLKQHQFKALSAIRGWHYTLLGAYDNGMNESMAKIDLKEYGLEAQYWINEVNADEAWNDAGIWDYVATDQVRFVDSQNQVKDLVDIPKLVFSEIMRDVDLFVGVASVGNDPEWRDNGGLPQYTNYWTSYSFGELTEIAKTRKEILEKLVPRLKIAKVATIEGKFLKIKGKKRVYKIHIGSTNILMEPNDQYLCIVQARGKYVNTDNVFLPFEGDKGLSIILSKGFLLAEDDKITDTTILSQINR